MSAGAGWAAGLAGALAAFGLGAWIGYLLGRNAQPRRQRREKE